jgi:hypothetical protein
MPQLSQCAGPVASWNGTHYDMDVIDGRVVVATSDPQPDALGFWSGAKGRWFRRLHPVEVDDVFAVEVTATWRGTAVHVVDQVLTGDRQVARVVPASDDVDEARGRGMTPLDVDVMESWVLLDELDDLTSKRLDPALPQALRPSTAPDSLPVPELGADKPAGADADPGEAAP